MLSVNIKLSSNFLCLHIENRRATLGSTSKPVMSHLDVALPCSAGMSQLGVHMSRTGSCHCSEGLALR